MGTGELLLQEVLQARLPGEAALPDGAPELGLLRDDVHSGATPGHCSVDVLPVLAARLPHHIGDCVLLGPLGGENSGGTQYKMAPWGKVLE